MALATDSPDALPQPTLRPVLDLNDPEAVADWLVSNQARFDYRAEVFV